MSIECIIHIEKSCRLKQELALEQLNNGNRLLAINYYIEAMSRLEILCTSYKAYLKTGPSLYLQYIEISSKLAGLYKKEQQLTKYQIIKKNIENYIEKVQQIIAPDDPLKEKLIQYQINVDNI